MFRAMATAGALALAALSTAPATAADFTLTTGPGAGSALFGNSGSTPGSIADSFSLTIISGLVDGYADTLSLTPSLDVTLTSVLLDAAPFTNTANSGVELFALAPTPIGAGRHKISVAGTWGPSGGAYSGSLDFVAGIPEPTSWALIVGGLGLAGIALRRRTSTGAYAV